MTAHRYGSSNLPVPDKVLSINRADTLVKEASPNTSKDHPIIQTIDSWMDPLNPSFKEMIDKCYFMERAAMHRNVPIETALHDYPWLSKIYQAMEDKTVDLETIKRNGSGLIVDYIGVKSADARRVVLVAKLNPRYLDEIIVRLNMEHPNLKIDSLSEMQHSVLVNKMNRYFTERLY